MIKNLVCTWIQWRYDGVFYALKPPCGYCKYAPKPRWWVALYKTKKLVWKIETVLFNRYGQDIRNKWLKSTGG